MHYYRISCVDDQKARSEANIEMLGELEAPIPIVPLVRQDPTKPEMKVPAWWKKPNTTAMIDQIQAAKRGT